MQIGIESLGRQAESSLSITSAEQPPVPVFKPLIEEDELTAARGALEMGWLGMGGYVGQFEGAVKEFIQAPDRHVVAVSTGHAALHLALLLAGVGKGDEVITPAFNNISDFQAILAVGAEPVFCDIEDDSLGIDLEKAASLVSPRTKAIIIMDYGCRTCNHELAAQWARRRHLRVIHDAAHAFGSQYQGKMIGSFSDLCIFSFDPVKTLTCIDGGALVVRTQAEVDLLHEMRLVGMAQPSSVMYQNRRAWTYEVRRLGFRYHMANLHAAIGVAQLRKMDRITATRRTACRYYNQRLQGIAGIRTPNTDFTGTAPFIYYVRVPARKREALRSHLKKLGIDTGIHWQPGHWFSLFKDCRRGDLSVTDRVGNEILSLPLHSSMSTATIDRVILGIHSFFGGGNDQ